MFGKLKDKLKDALSVFSKKTEEQADVKEDIVEIPLEPAVKTEAEKPIEQAVENGIKEKAVTPAQKPTPVTAETLSTIPPKPFAAKVQPVKEPTQSKPVPSKEHTYPQPAHKPVHKQSAADKPAHSVVTQKKHEKNDEKHEVETSKEHPRPKTITSTPEPIKEQFVKVEVIASVQEPQKKEEPQQEGKQEKKGFFAKIFSKKEEPIAEPLIEKKEVITNRKIDVTPVLHPTSETKAEAEVKEYKPLTSVQEQPSSTEDPKDKGFFGKIKEAITTKTISAEKFEELFWELELALLENNVSVEVIERIKDDLKTELVDKPLPRDVPKKIEETLSKTLREILTYNTIPLLEQIKTSTKKPFVIALFGINGAGKTTSIAKLTYYLQQHDLSIVLAACDTFRAAAIQQLEEHANRLNVKIIKHDYGSDAAAVAFDAIKYAEKNKIDIVLIDTAGRLHSNTNLMAELEKIIRVTKPDLKIFVGESITGNDCIEQARQFNKLVEMDGAILTKADVDEKGGAPLSISYTIKKPILFLGMGQEYKDLQPFDVELILKNLGF